MIPGELRASTKNWLTLTILAAGILFSRPTLVSELITMGAAAGLVAMIWLSRFTFPRMPLPLGALTALAGVSILWTEAPAVALPNAAYFVLMGVAGSFIAQLATPDQILRWLHRGILAACASSILLGTLTPHIGTDQRPAAYGSLIGIYVHKNPLSALMVMGVITAIYTPRTGQLVRTRLLASLALYTYAIIQAQSAAAFGLLLSSLLIAWILRRLATTPEQKRPLLATAWFCVAGIASIWLVLYFPTVIGWFGRDLTFSGRTDIWNGSLAAWHHQPILGYGMGGAFHEHSIAASTISKYTGGWIPPSSHSGYVSMLVQLGAVGFALMVATIVVTLRRALRLALRDATLFHKWMLVVLVAFAVNNLTDTRIDNTHWFLLSLVATYCHLNRSATVPTHPAPKRAVTRTGA